MSKEPQTLSEVQRLTTDDFRSIERYEYGGSVSASRVIDHLIELANDVLSWEGRQNANSLRDFWYNPVKAVLEAAVPDWKTGAGTSKWNRGLSKRLSKRLSKKVKDESTSVSYRGLNILDDSRDRRIATDSIENQKIIFVEKSAAYRKLEPLADVYDVTLVEGSGWSATALIEDLARQLDSSLEYTFYVLGDYDPAGFGIVDDFVNRASKLGLRVDEDQSRRIGVSPDQLPDDVVDEQKFTPSGSNIDEWLNSHGIDGEFGLEIEAVGQELEGKAEALRELVVGEIKDEIDADERRYQDTESSAAGVPYAAAQRVVDSITGDLEEALAETAVEVFEEQDGVETARHVGDGRTRVSLDKEAVLDGSTGGLVPSSYPASQLHSGAVSGNDPYPTGVRAKKRRLRGELVERIDDGEIDVEDLLNI